MRTENATLSRQERDAAPPATAPRSDARASGGDFRPMTDPYRHSRPGSQGAGSVTRSHAESADPR